MPCRLEFKGRKAVHWWNEEIADDSATARAHNVELLEQLVSPVLEEITAWMTNNSLTIAPEKSECAVCVTGKYSQHKPNLYVNGSLISVEMEIRYLEVQLDKRLSFVGLVVAESAEGRKSATALGRLMPNIGGPSQSERILLMSVLHSRLLYGAQVWGDSVAGTRKFEELEQNPGRVTSRNYHMDQRWRS